MSKLLSIDPGLSGALALHDGTLEKIDRVKYWIMPDTAQELAKILYENKDGIEHAWLEKVHSFPGQGVSSTWKFAQNYGIIMGILGALQIPYESISPQKWQQSMGLFSKDKITRKRQIKERAQAYYPHLRVTLKNADALAMLMVMEAQYRQNKGVV